MTGVVRLDNLAALGAHVRGGSGSRLGGPEAVNALGVSRVARLELLTARPAGEADTADTSTISPSNVMFKHKHRRYKHTGTAKKI